MVSVLLVELEAKEGPAGRKPSPRQGAKPLMSLMWLQDVCLHFPEFFYPVFPGMVPARTWWRAGPAGTSKVPAEGRLTWAMVPPSVLGLPAKRDLYGNTEICVLLLLLPSVAHLLCKAGWGNWGARGRAQAQRRAVVGRGEDAPWAGMVLTKVRTPWG